MSKRTITLVAGIGVLAALLLAYLIMSSAGVGQTPLETTAGVDPNLAVASYNYKDVLTVGYTNGGEMLNFTYNTNVGKWQYDGLKALPINLEIPTYMASAISTIQANRFIEDSAEHFADFGLDEPSLTVTISYSDGVSCEYHIGDYNAATDTYYFNVGGTNKVYTIAPGLLPYFQYSLLDLVDGETLPALYNTTYTLKGVTIGESTLDEDAMAAYKTSFAKVTLSSPVAWIADDSDKASFGLDAATVVEVKYTEAQNVTDSENTITSTVHVDGTLTLNVGSESSDGNRYCTIGDSIVVYEIAEIVLGVAE